jgi:26S proteasome regulatory subunit N3
MGEIPERAIFRQPGLKHALVPYLQLTKTVRVGDLDAFNAVVKTHKDLFVKDKTFTLIQRYLQFLIELT